VNRVEVQPELLRWARERSGLSVDALLHRFPKLQEWEDGATSPTLKQLENFATATHTPVGFLLLKETPNETVPIPDYRTVRDAGIYRPSADLLDTIYLCQQRQDWYRDHVRTTGQQRLAFVGSADLADDIVRLAARIRHAVGLDLEERRRLPTWTDALRLFIDK
jgi:transcriptional regulator with XRE-family HTH domain